MFKKIVCFLLAVILTVCLLCPASFADDSISEHTHDWVDLTPALKIEGKVHDLECSVSVKQCSICKFYDHKISLAGYTYDYIAATASPGFEGILQNLAMKLYASIFGNNSTATKAPTGISRKDLPGYADDNGTALVSSTGRLCLSVSPLKLNFGNTITRFLDHADFGQNIIGASGSGTSFPGDYSNIVYSFVAPVSGIYYVGSENKNYCIGSLSLYSQDSWNETLYYLNYTKEREYSITATQGKTYYFFYSFGKKSKGTPYKYSFRPITIFYEPLGDSSITTTNNITINNNTWNGNIYVDSSNNLTYIYPEYTTINENNETVTNISTNPIIYNSETQQYYTYDSTTNNYYYITYVESTPDPTPTPTPGGSGGGGSGSGSDVSTPETGKPGNSSGSSWWEKLLDKLGNAIIDGLLGAVSAVLKLIFKLFSTILGWIIWAVSRVFDLLPFLPPGLGALLVGGVVVCFVIGIIKFIRG